MNYEQFKEQFVKDLKDNLEAKGHNIESIDVIPNEKFNQGAYDSISVRLAESKMGPSGNLTAMYESYTRIDDYGMVLDHATNLMDDALSKMPSYSVSQLTDYEFIKDKLVIEAVNAEKNASLLVKVPHKSMEDIAIIYRAVLGKMDDGLATVVITNEMLEQMNVSKEQLHADAMLSTQAIRPVEVKSLFETLAELMPDFDMGLPVGGPEDQVMVGTVTEKVHGAGVIAYENFLDDMAQKMGGDFYIIPCSIHEVLLVPETMAHDVEALKDMILSVNSCEVAPEDILSDNLYHYDSKEKLFEITDKFLERMEEKNHEKESAVGKLKKNKDQVKETPRKEHKPKEKAEMAL